ncbi:MAG: hypothetical protein DWQ34_20885 [Planctomycetota bacterium]|nr:MAG: hypothetical protein DWQ34_20885 [Planctomycetota bacterium]REJ94760.1 MAG: hypothetical protein DWQ29_02715 [Planctomycetota bacterium]REK29216.1 MAG: hypothetical protein DWQ41_04500 [Planctomycetota bacterium]REK29400.1 MAG: hypothetical protein DWQ45_22790 [Planctomycetota bacterium]
MKRFPGWKLSVLMLALCTAGSGCAATQRVAGRLNPDRQRAYDTKSTLAQVYEKEGKLREAVELYRDLYESYEDDVLATHRLGVAMTQLGSEEEGLFLLEEAHLLAPEDPEILNDLGYAYILAGDLETAEKLIQRAYGLQPENERTVANLALVAGYAGRDKECLSLFKQVVSEAEAHANLAYICSQRGNGSLAMEHYSRALDYDPDLRPAAVGLTQLHQMKQEFEREQAAIAARQPAAESNVQSAAATEPADVAAEPGRVQLTGGEFDWAQE